MPTFRMKPAVLAIAAALIGLGIGLDQATKVWALGRLPKGAIDIVEGALTLQYAENRNFAFGLGSLLPAWARLAVVISLTLVLLVLMLRSADLPSLIGFGMAIAGSIGNIVDRIRLGFVVDFVYWHYGFRWPNFNVADSFVVCGVAVLLIFGDRSTAKTAKSAPAT